MIYLQKNEKMKGIAYLRVSTEQQDLIRQKSLIDEYIVRNNIELIKKFEDKETGTTFNRKGLIELLNCNKNDADIVIISEISRFARNEDILEFLNQIGKVLRNGLDLVFLDNPNTIYKAGQELNITEILLLIVGAYTASQERKLILERLETKREYLIKQNHYAYHVGTNYWGFNVVPNPEYRFNKSVAKRIIQIDKEKAEIIREIFRRYSEGETSYNIWRWFCSLDIEDKRGRTFIMKMLNNPIYIGERYCKGNMYKIEPIISQNIWEKVREKKAENKIYYSNVRNHPLNLFKGLIKCGKCGASMTIMYPPINRKEGKSFYTCLHKIEDKIPQNKTKCKSFNIPRKLVEEIVWHSYHQNIGDKAFSDATKLQTDIIQNKINDNTTNLKHLEKIIKKNEREIERMQKFILEYVEEKELVQVYIKEFHELSEKNTNYNKQKEEYKKENILLQQQINELEKNALFEDDLEITDNELAKQYQTHIKSITVYSKQARKHFIQIIYKNKVHDTFIVKWWHKNNEVYNIGNGIIIIENEIPLYVNNEIKYDWDNIFEICSCK